MFASIGKLIAWYGRLLRGASLPPPAAAAPAGASLRGLRSMVRSPVPRFVAARREHARSLKPACLILPHVLRDTNSSRRRIGSGASIAEPPIRLRPKLAAPEPKRTAPRRHVWLETRTAAAPQRGPATLIPLESRQTRAQGALPFALAAAA